MSITRVDTGWGTTYERIVVNRLLSRLLSDLNVCSLVEGPGDGMWGIAGLNSLIAGVQGVRVSLVLPSPARAAFAKTVWAHHAPDANPEILNEWDGRRMPFADGAFDLAWNYNVMTRTEDPQALLNELTRVSRKYVLIFVPNRRNYGFWLHRLHHRVTGEPWDHGPIDLMQTAPWSDLFAKAGLRVQQTFLVDCPWWPDIHDAGQLLRDFFPFLGNLVRGASPTNRYRWTPEEIPYYNPEVQPEVHQRMARLTFFENLRTGWLKQRFAHHVGVLGVKV
jgi:ubiquinone/menaquinone biosynthesis C-methylase UbiE